MKASCSCTATRLVWRPSHRTEICCALSIALRVKLVGDAKRPPRCEDEAPHACFVKRLRKACFKEDLERK
jgi:hypothetical protein